MKSEIEKPTDDPTTVDADGVTDEEGSEFDQDETSKDDFVEHADTEEPAEHPAI